MIRSLFLHLAAFAWVAILFAICAPLAILWPTLAWRNKLSLWAGLHWSRFVLWLCGIKLELSGEENLVHPAILTFNHTNILDFFLNAFYAGDRCLVFGKRSLSRIPFVGWGWMLGGHPMVERTRPEQWHLQLARVESLMRESNYSTCIAPEGKRSYDGQLLPFKKGAFHLAINTKRPIVPVVIHGAAPRLKRRSLPSAGTIRVEILPALSTEGWALETIEQHSDELRAIYLEALGQAPTAAETPHSTTPA